MYYTKSLEDKLKEHFKRDASPALLGLVMASCVGYEYGVDGIAKEEYLKQSVEGWDAAVKDLKEKGLFWRLKRRKVDVEKVFAGRLTNAGNVAYAYACAGFGITKEKYLELIATAWDSGSEQVGGNSEIAHNFAAWLALHGKKQGFLL